MLLSRHHKPQQQHNNNNHQYPVSLVLYLPHVDLVHIIQQSMFVDSDFNLVLALASSVLMRVRMQIAYDMYHRMVRTENQLY